MASKVHKYTIPLGRSTLLLPAGLKMFPGVGLQDEGGEQVRFWGEAPVATGKTKVATVEVAFAMVPTGEEVPAGMSYLGSAFFSNGLVQHAYYETAKPISKLL